MINIISIYFLHVGDGIPFYVGKTNNPRTRQTNHRSNNNNPNIILEVIDEVELSEWKYWECYWIEQFKHWGFKLKNGNNGGGGITNHTFESRLKSSKSLKGRIMNEDWKRKNSLSSLLTNTSGPVYQYDKQNNFIQTWEAACLAEDQYNPGDRRKRDNIRACIRGKQKTAYGFIWKENY
jgi:hypothetical protein